MFGLIRRISYSVIPRPDRPWEDDRAFRFLHNVRVLIRNAFFFAFLATSNAPHKSKKRRMSASEEPEPDMEQANKKKVRGESSTPSVADSSEVHVRLSTPLPQPETQEVKEVTQGVKDVELEVGSAPEDIPLPDEESDDLESSSNATTPPPETLPRPDEPADDSASDNLLPQDESEAVDETTVIEKEGPEGSVAVNKSEDAPVPDVTATVEKPEPTRKLRSKT